MNKKELFGNPGQLKGEKMKIECLCKECNIVTSHDFQKSIIDDVLTKITVCDKCGKATVDCGPNDDDEAEKGIPFDEKRMFDCLGVCESCQEFACPNNKTRCQ